MQIKSLDGTSYYLVEIIAFVLCHLKHVLEEHHTRSGASLADLDWVITVPAIWMASGKQMMREAAYLVSLIKKFLWVHVMKSIFITLGSFIVLLLIY